MKRIMTCIALAAAVLAGVSCAQEVVRTRTGRLGVRTVSAEEGSFLVLVSTDGVWSVRSADSWIHVDDRYFKGETAFEVHYDSNESTTEHHRFCRLGRVVVKTYDGARADTLVVMQEGIEPYFGLAASYELDAAAGSCSLPLRTNLTDKERPSVRCKTDASWVTASWGRDGKSVDVRAAAGSGRSATLTLIFRDAWGREYTSSATLRQ